MKLITDKTEFQEREYFSKVLDFNKCLELDLFASPDSKKKLFKSDDDLFLSDGEFNYEFSDGSPILYPRDVSENMANGELSLDYYENPLHQYILMSQIKQRGEINAPIESTASKRHKNRFANFVQDIQGLTLDIGSDRPSISCKLLPESCDYIGLDPYAGSGEFRVIGLGEILPFSDSKFDAVLFNTSLDHMLDYHSSIDEACRVLKPGGSIIIATYAWLFSASLLKDNIHFHHFREYEIIGALDKNFSIKNIERYEDPKESSHRYGLYVSAIKG